VRQTWAETSIRNAAAWTFTTRQQQLAHPARRRPGRIRLRAEGLAQERSGEAGVASILSGTGSGPMSHIQ